MISAFYIILALLGLSLLVFIHELGHYFVARRNGMRVEVFSIGLGKPMVSWMRKGVKWQVCPILFGGYVRIAGMEKEGDLEPYEVPEGFYSKKPWARIKVALAGPIVNLVFAVVVFAAIWVSGGREKPFAQFTRLIGSIEPQSELYQKGIRPGDELAYYNGKPFKGFEDLVYASIMNGRPAEVEGSKINYFTSQKTPYEYTVTPYESSALRKGMKTVGIMSPASYLIYQELNEVSPESPLYTSGIENQDQIVWVDGQLIFSDEQLRQVLNSGKVLIHYERDGKIYMGKIPRLALRDLSFDANEKAELVDWQYEAGMDVHATHYFVPYNLSTELVVEKSIPYLGERSHFQTVHTTAQTSHIDTILKTGDRILALDGIPVQNSYDFLKRLQERQVQVIVKRGETPKKVSWKEEDAIFEKETDWDGLLPIIHRLGTDHLMRQNGNFHLLNPITPIKRKDFPYSPQAKALFEKSLKKQREQIEKIDDAEEREHAYELLDQIQSQYVLGAALQDRFVIYNPQPFALFAAVFNEITRNLAGLISGYLSPKYFGGPLMIVQVMHQSWGMGVKEALFWLGAISLNLGILNLLPIPVLDGGHICFSLIEAVRKKPMKAKTMRRMIFPFVVLLIFFFVYLTYNDLTRLFGRFF